MRQERATAISPASVVPSSVAFLMILSILIRVNIAERKNGTVYADIADTEMDTPVAINIGSYVKTYENKAYGQMIIQVPDSKVIIDKIYNFLNEKQIQTMEVSENDFSN